MHLWLENLGKNLIHMWQGKFKGGELDIGQPYRIADDTWEQIGLETVAASATIPSQFGRSTPNVATQLYIFTAEDFGFWLLFLAPHLLKDRFPQRKFYDHFMLLNRILLITLQFSFTLAEIEDLRELIIEWVTTYEKLYYQYNVKRLKYCFLPLHALLHVPDDIINSGPPCNTWTFVMERWCLYMTNGVTSRAHPFTTLAFYVYHGAQLNDIQSRYNLTDLLDISSSHDDDKLSIHPLSVLRSPRTLKFEPGRPLRQKICNYFSVLFAPLTVQDFDTLLPRVMPFWGKVRIIGRNESISSTYGQRNRTGRVRDASYIRYGKEVDRNAHFRNLPIVLERRTCYGRLEAIIQCNVPSNGSPQLRQPELHLVALVTECITNGADAADGTLVTYTKMQQSSSLIDLNLVESVVGRFQVGDSKNRRWAIIDRSDNLARTIFTDPKPTPNPDSPDSDDIE
ncbi:hypothetical protein DL93DRAFT_2149474 [Clavulina sp. PMI_390]|nr:hypothetical protein DL93DRAFT_2149474 [Clavulina sp. PMI_390]